MINRPRITKPETDRPGYDARAVSGLLRGVKGVVPGNLVCRVLAAAGIPTPVETRLERLDDLETLEDRIPYPWVMKVIGPLHKSDLGGVVTDVGDMTRARAVFQNLMNIERAEGVLVQPMVAGPEALIGLSREDSFGHLTACGLGGIYAEALGDVRFTLAPLSGEEALAMIQGLRGRAILEGMRGRPGMDLDRLADLVVRVSLLARDAPGIRELDINPVKGVGRDLWAVDARIIMEP